MSVVALSIVYFLDLALFVLVFVIIRLRRVSGRAVAGIIILTALAYLATFALLIFLGIRS